MPSSNLRDWLVIRSLAAILTYHEIEAFESFIFWKMLVEDPFKFRLVFRLCLLGSIECIFQRQACILFQDTEPIDINVKDISISHRRYLDIAIYSDKI